MSFSLVTAINIEDVPIIMQNAARNYLTNAEHDEKIILERTKLRRHYPELWVYAAQLLDEAAAKLGARIAEERLREVPAAAVAVRSVKRALL